MKEREKPFVPPEPFAEIAPRDDVRAAASPVRCPYCHSDVSPDSRDWVACRACLARHHQGCWNESGACASCRSPEKLVGPPVATKPRRRAPVVVLAAIAVACLVAVAASVAVGALAAGSRAKVMAERRAEAIARLERERGLQEERARAEARQAREKRLFDAVRAQMATTTPYVFRIHDRQGKLEREVSVPFHALSVKYLVGHPIDLELTPEQARAVFPTFGASLERRLTIVMSGVELPFHDFKVVGGDKTLAFTGAIDPGDVSDAQLESLEKKK